MRALISAGVMVLEVMFAVGVLGSVLVILLTTVEDVKVLLQRDERRPSAS